MIIEKINIGSFGGISGREISFARGINILEGANETGKSRVLAFIRFMFYGFTPIERRIYTGAQEGRAFGSLELLCAKGRYRIERSVGSGGKGMPDEEVTIYDLASGSPIKGNDPALLFINVTKDLFEHSSFMGQFENRAMRREDLSAAIENMLSGANESIYARKSAEELTVRLEKLEGEGGKIAENSEKAQELDERYARACKNEEEIKRLTEALVDHSKKKKSNERQLEESKKLYEHVERKQKLERLKRAAYAYAKKEAAEKTLSALHEKYTENGFCPDPSYAREAEELEAKTARALEMRDEYAQEREKALEALSALPEAPKGKKGRLLDAIDDCRKTGQKQKNFLFASALGAVVFAAAAIFFFVFGVIPGGIVASLLVAACIGLSGLFYIGIRKAKKEEEKLYKGVGAQNKEELSRAVERYAEINAERQNLEKQIEDLDKRLEKGEETISKLFERAAILSARWGKTAENIGDLRALKERAAAAVKEEQEALEEAERAKMILDASGEQPSEEELRLLIKRQKEDGVTKELSPEEIKEVQMKIKFYTQTIAGLDKKINAEENELARLQNVTEDSEELKAQRAVILDEEEELKKEALIMRACRDAILETVDYMRCAILPGVLEIASSFISSATGGKYTALLAGENGTLALHGEERDFALEELSGGTLELCYLALRLGISRRLYQTEQIPFFFDESFVHFDDTRKAYTFNALSNICTTDDQFILLTCHKRDAALFEKIAKVNQLTI